MKLYWSIINYGEYIDTGHHMVFWTIQASEHYSMHDMASQGPLDHSSTEVMHH